MEGSAVRVFIVSDNALVANGLKHLLWRNFQGLISVCCYYDLRSTLQQLKYGCDLIIVDKNLDGITATEALQSINLICPETEGIIYDTNTHVLNELASYLQKVIRDSKEEGYG